MSKIILFNKWFDLLNTQQKYDKGIESYNHNEKSQNELIEKMNNFIKHMSVYGKKLLLPFQKCEIFSLFISNNL